MNLNLTGYTQIGTVDFFSDAYDTESAVMVLVSNTTGQLFQLVASGCVCCSNLWDGLTTADAESVSLEGLAASLFGAAQEQEMDSADLIETNAAIQGIVQIAALALSSFRGPSPAIQS